MEQRGTISVLLIVATIEVFVAVFMRHLETEGSIRAFHVPLYSCLYVWTWAILCWWIVCYLAWITWRWI